MTDTLKVIIDAIGKVGVVDTPMKIEQVFTEILYRRIPLKDNDKKEMLLATQLYIVGGDFHEGFFKTDPSYDYRKYGDDSNVIIKKDDTNDGIDEIPGINYDKDSEKDTKNTIYAIPYQSPNIIIKGKGICPLDVPILYHIKCKAVEILELRMLKRTSSRAVIEESASVVVYEIEYFELDLFEPEFLPDIIMNKFEKDEEVCKKNPLFGILSTQGSSDTRLYLCWTPPVGFEIDILILKFVDMFKDDNIEEGYDPTKRLRVYTNMIHRIYKEYDNTKYVKYLKIGGWFSDEYPMELSYNEILLRYIISVFSMKIPEIYFYLLTGLDRKIYYDVYRKNQLLKQQQRKFRNIVNHQIRCSCVSRLRFIHTRNGFDIILNLCYEWFIHGKTSQFVLPFENGWALNYKKRSEYLHIYDNLIRLKLPESIEYVLHKPPILELLLKVEGEEEASPPPNNHKKIRSLLSLRTICMSSGFKDSVYHGLDYYSLERKLFDFYYKNIADGIHHMKDTFIPIDIKTGRVKCKIVDIHGHEKHNIVQCFDINKEYTVSNNSSKKEMSLIEFVEKSSQIIHVVEKNEKEGVYKICSMGDHLVMTAIGKKLHFLFGRMTAKGIIDYRKSILKIQKTKFKKDKGIDLSETQLDAINHIIENPFTIITGEGGTGKTTIIDVICNIYEHSDIALLSAYGTVASRLSKSHPDACTINMANALYNKNMTQDKTTSVSKRTESIVIIDEMSVLNMFHLNMVINTYPCMTKLVLLGDPNQTTAIDRGDIVKSFIERYKDSNIIVKLDTVYRISGCAGWATMKLLFQRILDGEGGTIPCYKGGRITKHPVTLLPRHYGNMFKTFLPIIEAFKTPNDWQNIQIITQRHVERVAICKLLLPLIPTTRKYFTSKITDFSDRNMRSMKYDDNDLYVGEKVVFKHRVKDWNEVQKRKKEEKEEKERLMRHEKSAYNTKSDEITEDNTKSKRSITKLFIYKSSLKVISKIVDMNKRNWGLQKSNIVSTKEKWTYGRNTIRIIHFTDGCQYALIERGDIYKIGRGTCVTIASMQGGECTTVIIYIREGVSFTFDVNQLYTASSRAMRRIIFIGTLEEIAKISKRLPRERNNCLIYYLPFLSLDMTEIDSK